jgi:hypothetical protein
VAVRLAQPGGAAVAQPRADDAQPAVRIGQDPGRPGNGEAELWRYVGYRFPQLISFAFPFSFLLGALITFTTLNQNSEVVAMKAAGCRRTSCSPR